jgi:hypothetical protein
VQVVADGDGGLGCLRVLLQPHEAGHRADAVIGIDGHDRVVVVAVDLGQVAQLRRRQVRLRAQEAALDALLGQAAHALRELLLVVGADLAEVDERVVREAGVHGG